MVLHTSLLNTQQYKVCIKGKVVKVPYFKIWNKKEHNIIISGVISSHMGPMYIEIPYSDALGIDPKFWKRDRQNWKLEKKIESTTLLRSVRI